MLFWQERSRVLNQCLKHRRHMINISWPNKISFPLTMSEFYHHPWLFLYLFFFLVRSFSSYHLLELHEPEVHCWKLHFFSLCTNNSYDWRTSFFTLLFYLCYANTQRSINKTILILSNYITWYVVIIFPCNSTLMKGLSSFESISPTPIPSYFNIVNVVW